MYKYFIHNFSQSRLIIAVSTFLVFFANYTFYKNVLITFPINSENIWFLISTVIVFISLIVFVFSLVSSKYTTKPILIIVVLISSLTNYFMNTYNVIIDDDMIRNLLQTDIQESLDLLTIKQVLYFIFLGILPSFLIYKSHVKYRSFEREVFSKLKSLFISLAIIAALIFSFFQHYTSLFREHKPLRYTSNPTYWIYSIGTYIDRTYTSNITTLSPLGRDAKVVTNSKQKKIVIMVVGEAARADHFSLNGYSKKTNPLLEKENVINFSNVYSCGTSTAISVPCMFSVFEKGDFDYQKGISYENSLDVISHTKDVEILWRDNNSDSKGVAVRLPFEDYKGADKNTICIEGECRDIGLLVGLEDYIEQHKGKDILIVLHQMGNHGPAYYKRYTKEFEIFEPVCKTNQIERCEQEEISNAYDNALLYTDYFLSETIKFLKQYNDSHHTAMIYMSDHGESLGENGIYLHGLPYFMAPEAQIHVGSLAWFNESMAAEINAENIRKNKDRRYSQDNLFHTLLDIFDVETEVYKENMSMFK